MAKVLLVDDEWSIRELCVLMLNKIGHEAVAVSSADECVELLETYKPDLCLIDVVLPDRSGMELAIDISTKYPGTPLILMSGRISTEADSVKSLVGHFGVYCTLSKPFTITEFEQAVKLALGGACS
jgi:DNA-binding response OmpR family regulator